MFITNTTWHYTQADPNKLYTKEADGTLVAFNSSYYSPREKTKLLAEGIRDVLKQRSSNIFNEKRNKALEETYTNSKVLKAQALYQEYVQLTRKSKGLFRSKRKQNQVFAELENLAFATDLYNFYRYSGQDIDSARYYWQLIRDKCSRVHDDAEIPSLTTIEATLTTIPDVDKKSFEELLKIFE